MQRLLLAQALLGRPKLLLLDEPLVSLDPHFQQTIVALAKRIQHSEGMTVLFTAHELNPLLGSMDRVLYLGQGHAALGAVDEVITGDGLRLRVYEDGDRDNPTVLLVHGFPDTAKVWEPLVGELRDRFHVVRYDVRGMGGSQRASSREGYRVERLADDVIRVAQATGKRPAYAIGSDAPVELQPVSATDYTIPGRYPLIISFANPDRLDRIVNPAP